MTTVTLRNHGITVEATEVGDRDTVEAFNTARKLRDDGVEFDKALVDRFDGLVLIGGQGNWHFSSPLCGYGGTGPIISARILSVFGFGAEREILAKIDHGGEKAKATLYR